jgi:hypothetical protein
MMDKDNTIGTTTSATSSLSALPPPVPENLYNSSRHPLLSQRFSDGYIFSSSPPVRRNRQESLAHVHAVLDAALDIVQNGPYTTTTSASSRRGGRVNDNSNNIISRRIAGRKRARSAIVNATVARSDESDSDSSSTDQ